MDLNLVMRKTILLYGIALAVLIGILKLVEYHFFMQDLSIEFYIGTVAVLFVCLGAWVGSRLIRPKVVVAEKEVIVEVEKLVVVPEINFQVNEAELDRLGISKREYEVLELISQGMSNQEIADKLFVSMNTVKTHSSNLFGKLDARRRTQAIQRARELGLLP